MQVAYDHGLRWSDQDQVFLKKELDYFSKHTKTDRLDAELAARPLVHPEGLRLADGLGPADLLKRVVKVRARLVHRHHRDRPFRLVAGDSRTGLGRRPRHPHDPATFKFLASSANPHQVKRLGAARLARCFQHHSRKA